VLAAVTCAVAAMAGLAARGRACPAWRTAGRVRRRSASGLGE
jgi:hypothetical protein